MQNTRKNEDKKNLRKKDKKNCQMKRRKAFEIRKEKLEHVRDLNEVEKVRLEREKR